ncbi:MAG: gliding motility protein GldC [Chitinophagaceae bacterium]|nr:MAG: gliding motility protein GldC [Chitinophagaceae bacterium]
MQSTITIDIGLDDKKVCKDISWKATQSTADAARAAKAMILAFWDGADKTAMRIDLWTKEMMMDEMTDFYFQTMMSMADNYERATHQTELVNDMKKFAQDFLKKFHEIQLAQNKAT